MDFDNMIKLKDFASERGVSVNTITQYIKSHPEIKEHTHHDTANKNTMYLDDEAVKLLSKKYRVSTQIITNTELMEKLEASNEMIMKLAQKVLEMTEERNERLMIATTNEELQNKIEKLEADNEMHRLEAEKLRLEQNNMIDGNYIDILRRIAKLRREKRKNSEL